MASSQERICTEFIQNYYNVFNNDPDYLFSFYNEHSLFTHKSITGTNKESGLVVGELRINQIMKLLNFDKCRIKLNRMKCILTAGNLNVIEAFGELTDTADIKYNFKQTFVLELRDYVESMTIRSSIFPYQDQKDVDDTAEHRVLNVIRSKDERDFNDCNEMEKSGCRLEQQTRKQALAPEKQKKVKLSKKEVEAKKKEYEWFERTTTAIRTGDLDLLGKLLKYGPSINKKDENGRTLLHEAVTHDKAKIVSYLLKNGANVLQATNKGFTPLHVAALEGHTRMVSTLFREISEHTFNNLIDAKTLTTGDTALDIAIKKRYYGITKILINCNASTQMEMELHDWIRNTMLDDDYDDSIADPDDDLFEADGSISDSDSSSFEKTKYLEVGNEFIDEDTKDVMFNMFLDLALLPRRSDEIFPLQTSRVQELDRLLMRAETLHVKMKNCIPQLEKAMDRKGRLNLKDGSHILNYALELVEAFEVYQSCVLKRFEDPSIAILRKVLKTLEFDKAHSYSEKGSSFVSKGEGTRYYQLLRSTGIIQKMNFIEYVSELIEPPTESFVKSIYASKIFDAVQRDDFSFVMKHYYKVNNDRSPQVIDVNGRAPLHIAVLKNSEKMVKTLLGAGAAIEVPTATTKSTALHIAAANGRLAIVELLLLCNSSGRFIDAVTAAKNSTALHAAANFNHLSIVKSLLTNGATYCARDADERTPADLSTSDKIVVLLRLADELFDLASEGGNELVSKLKKLQRDVLLAVGNARNGKGKTVIEVAAAAGHTSVAGEVKQVIKKMMKIRNRGSKRK